MINDPRIAEAKRLIAEVLADATADLNRVRRADPSRATEYQSHLDALAAARGAPPIWPYLSGGVGNGPYVQLADGSVKLDFIGGIGVYGAGHSHPRIIDAAIDAAIEDVPMQGNLQQSVPSVELLRRLIALAGGDGSAIELGLLTTSGAMANENALKLAFHKSAATPSAANHGVGPDRILAFDNAFAGRSLALAALTDRPAYRAGLPLVLPVDYLPFYDPADPDRSTRWAVDELHRLLARHPGRYAGFWAELIAGEGGYYPGNREFFESLCVPLREAGIPIIFDEVQSFSRTSRPFAFQHFGLQRFADIVTVGKITQACATLYRKSFHPTGPILSQTFTGASASIATGLATLDLIEEMGCYGEDGENMRRHGYFAAQLQSLADEFAGQISGPFGEGMMIVLTAGDGSAEAAKSMMFRLFDAGLLGFVCGSAPTRIRFLPPPAITRDEHIDAAVAILRGVLKGSPTP